MTHEVPGRQIDNEVVKLTPRELQVVRLVFLGYITRETAVLLGIAEGTVTTLLHRVYDKLGIESRRQLLDYVMSGHQDLLEHGETRRNCTPHPEGCGCDSVYCHAMRLARIN